MGIIFWWKQKQNQHTTYRLQTNANECARRAFEFTYREFIAVDSKNYYYRNEMPTMIGKTKVENVGPMPQNSINVSGNFCVSCSKTANITMHDKQFIHHTSIPPYIHDILHSWIVSKWDFQHTNPWLMTLYGLFFFGPNCVFFAHIHYSLLWTFITQVSIILIMIKNDKINTFCTH